MSADRSGQQTSQQERRRRGPMARVVERRGIPTTLLGGGFSFFVSVLHPPCAACEPASLRIPIVRCLFFLALLISICFIFLLLLPYFSISIWTSFVSSCLVLVSIICAVSSVSVSVSVSVVCVCSSH